MTPALSLTGLRHEYVSGLPVLDGLDLELYPGEVVALMGENGAGKSTLAAILAGIIQPTAGKIALSGHPYRPKSRPEAQRAGISLVMQELSLIKTLTVAENLTLEAMPNRLGIVDRRRQNQRACKALSRVGASEIDPVAVLGGLGIAMRQLVEIAAGLMRECKVLILDEPTSSLSPSESEALFDQICLLRDQGVCVVYISHRLNEVLRLADRTIVLRDGRVVQTFEKDTLDHDSLVKAMVGRALSTRKRISYATKTPALQLRSVRGVSLQVNKGEVLGLAGLVGSGRTELLRSVFGADRPSGEVLLGGQRLWPRTPRAAVRAGLGFVTEDRNDQGLFLPLSVRTNISVASLVELSRACVVNRHAELELAKSSRDELGIRSRTVEQPVALLSGGNQQKVVLAKWIARNSVVLLLDEPTRGIDIGARQEIYDLIERMAGLGKAVLLASSDLNELLGLCDRIIVLSGGRVADELPRDEFDPDRIMSSALAAHGVATG